ncbi:YkvA family protein [Kitasatospora sp. NBC_01539]|uniref:YkvA family protein n=1 Tax=Kitasatospora sp. NBC_01539 TaxID=2903577 RepID=UPI00386019D5
MDVDVAVWWCVAGVLVVVTLVVVVRLFVRLLRARRMLGSSGVPLSTRLGFWAAVVYVVLPVDLLPDPILLDDIGVLLLALRSLGKAASTVAPAARHRR